MPYGVPLNRPSRARRARPIFSSSNVNSGRNFCAVVSLWLPRLAQNSFVKSAIFFGAPRMPHDLFQQALLPQAERGVLVVIDGIDRDRGLGQPVNQRLLLRRELLEAFGLELDESGGAHPVDETRRRRKGRSATKQEDGKAHLPLWYAGTENRATRTFGPRGAQTAGSVGPNSASTGVPTAAARCVIPESFPI